MQSIPHSMAHRGAGATRTNARWHPYTPPRAPVAGAGTPNYALLACSSNHHLQQQESTYLITPAPSVYSISPSASTCSQSPHPLTSAAQQAGPSCSKQIQPQKPQLTKANYVASLVDQAVKSLTDIWRPENIPAVFSTQTDITVVAKQPPTLQLQCQSLKRQQHQLPSPRSPNTLSSPLSPSVGERPQQVPLSSSTILPSAFLAEHFGSNASTIVCEKDLVPIKTFVQEVLRRSRTTCSVLQSALCYIEAVRGKVPELVEKEKCGIGAKGEPELAERITREDETSVSSKWHLPMNSSALNDLQTELMTVDPFDTSGAPTVLQKDSSLPSDVGIQSTDRRRKIPPKPLMPLPPLPSPLLCPRRTFLAALILASKFLQDRCYSNRAWAKLSGLPPREVGRCERALGDALGWRLWVGKGASGPREDRRGIHRTNSEGSLAYGPSLSGSPSTMQFLSPPLADAGASPEFGRASGKAVLANRALRRAATLPDDVSMRSVPPRYRSPGSLPFSFACPPVAVVATHQQTSLSAQQTLLSSSFTSRVPLSSDPTPISGEDPTPRLSYSPLSLGECPLETPSVSSFGLSSVFNLTTGPGDIYSPAHSTGSNDSSDSGSSSGSEAIATPPDMPVSGRLPHLSSETSNGDVLSSGSKAAQCQVFAPADMTNSVEWFTQMMSTGVFRNGNFGSIGADGSGVGGQGQKAMSVSMLDLFVTPNADPGATLGLCVQN